MTKPRSTSSVITSPASIVLPRPTSSASSIRVVSDCDAPRKSAELVWQRIDHRLRRRDERPDCEGVRDPRRSDRGDQRVHLVGFGASHEITRRNDGHPLARRVPDTHAFDAECLSDLDDLNEIPEGPASEPVPGLHPAPSRVTALS